MQKMAENISVYSSRTNSSEQNGNSLSELAIDYISKSKLSKIRGLNLSKSKMRNIWTSTLQIIENQLLEGKGVNIQGLGIFALNYDKLDVGNAGTKVYSVPVFILAPNFTSSYGISSRKKNISVPVSMISYSKVGLLANVSREVALLFLRDLFRALGEIVNHTNRRLRLDCKICRIEFSNGFSSIKWKREFLMKLREKNLANMQAIRSKSPFRKVEIALNKARMTPLKTEKALSMSNLFNSGRGKTPQKQNLSRPSSPTKSVVHSPTMERLSSRRSIREESTLQRLASARSPKKVHRSKREQYNASPSPNNEPPQRKKKDKQNEKPLLEIQSTKLNHPNNNSNQEKMGKNKKGISPNKSELMDIGPKKSPSKNTSTNSQQHEEKPGTTDEEKRFSSSTTTLYSSPRLNLVYQQKLKQQSLLSESAPSTNSFLSSYDSDAYQRKKNMINDLRLSWDAQIYEKKKREMMEREEMMKERERMDKEMGMYKALYNERLLRERKKAYHMLLYNLKHSKKEQFDEILPVGNIFENRREPPTIPQKEYAKELQKQIEYKTKIIQERENQERIAEMENCQKAKSLHETYSLQERLRRIERARKHAKDLQAQIEYNKQLQQNNKEPETGWLNFGQDEKLKRESKERAKQLLKEQLEDIKRRYNQKQEELRNQSLKEAEELKKLNEMITQSALEQELKRIKRNEMLRREWNNQILEKRNRMEAELKENPGALSIIL